MKIQNKTTEEAEEVLLIDGVGNRIMGSFTEDDISKLKEKGWKRFDEIKD